MATMGSSTSFYHQVKRRIFFIALILSIFLFGLFALLFSRENTLYAIKGHTFPTLESQVDVHNLIRNSDRLLIQFLMADNAQNFDLWLTQYHTNLEQLMKKDTRDKQLARPLLAEVTPFFLTINRLSANTEKNEQLRQSTIVQLQLVITALSDASTNRGSIHQRLYLQSITLLSRMLMMMETLSISTDIAKFTYLTDNLNDLIQQWLVITTEDATIVNAKVAASLSELNNLLWVEQRSIAKWRSHMRISQDFLAIVDKHHQLLVSESERLTLVNLPSNILWPKEILPWIPSKFKISNEAYYISISAISCVFVLILMLLLYLLSVRIKKYQRYSISLIEQRVQGEVSLPVISTEQQQTLDLINQLEQPHHSEDDYQRLNTLFEQHQLLNFQHAQTLIWYTKSTNNENHPLRELLALVAGQLWYHAFAREVVTKMLNDARQAKRDGGMVQSVIKSKQGHTFSLTIEYTDNHWQGTLRAQEAQAQLEVELETLNIALNKAEQNGRFQQIEQSQKLSKMLIRTMLQNQSASLGLGVTSLNVYRHLIRMLEWSKQLQLTTALGANDRQVQLTDVNFINELYALVTNISVDANLQRNSVRYSVDSSIVEECKLNVRLFHQTLSHLCQTLLQEQFKAHLNLSISMVDKNSGQQILSFVFTITHEENAIILPDAIAALIQAEESELENEQPLTRYFYRLFKATYCADLHTKTVDKGYQITFNMPITTSGTTIKAYDQVNLNQRNILLISNDLITNNTVEHLAKKHHAMITTMANSKYFTQQVSVKHLTKKAVAVVVVGVDAFNRDFGDIYQHIKSLPKGLQPKIFVLQPLCNQLFHRAGMFEHTQTLLHSVNFAEVLKHFIKGDSDTNLLLSAELFKQYRFATAQIEVLLAVKQPKQHEILQRLMHWMGLQVHLVSNQQQMLKQWQSGRYLILLNDFDISPVMSLEVGKKVKRTIFAFSEAQLTQYRKDITDENQHWEITLLPPVLDVNALVKEFSPWLKEQLPSNSSVVHPKIQPEMKKITTQVIPMKADNAYDGAFDLAKYAQNQGSSELAAFMLNDYIDEIDTNIEQLKQAIKRKDALNAVNCLQAIIKVAKIIAANDVLNVSKQLSSLLTNKDFKACVKTIKELEQKFKLLANCAQAI